MNPFADLTGDVGNHLHSAAVVIPPALLVDHGLVNRTGGHAVEARHGRVGKAFVVAQVQVCFRTVFGDEDFTVLDRAHRARIHIQVRIQLQDRNVVTPGFQQAPKARGHDPLADAGDDTTGDEDELGHDLQSDSSSYLA